MSILNISLKSIALIFITCLLFSCKTEKEPTTTEEIIEKHFRKVGGNLLGSSIKTLQLVSKTIYEDNSYITITNRFEFPHKLHQNQLYAGALQDYILNDDIGYSIKNNIQFKTLKPFEIRHLQEDAHLMTFYRWKERGWKYEYKNKQSIDNQEHFVLHGINDSIHVGNRVYINTSSFLIKRIEVKSATFNASSDFNDYVKRDGLLYPNETVTEDGSYPVTTKVSGFFVNPTFDPSIFEVKVADK